ncbi:hypothetical protein CEXT_177581 [Caerostris extrusa]|uniref:DUF5641 domain-containing protein n=1 Tax=Caerostris extrusa TaxID=172846 RepID=A0AAV4WNA6_CAEEX|nr:hypothetical protein CEXT_177581 [Caerostris extrusa]
MFVKFKTKFHHLNGDCKETENSANLVSRGSAASSIITSHSWPHVPVWLHEGRSKWLRYKPNLNINDLGLIKDDNFSPAKWRFGRIIELYPGTDRKVRDVKLDLLLEELELTIH